MCMSHAINRVSDKSLPPLDQHFQFPHPCSSLPQHVMWMECYFSSPSWQPINQPVSALCFSKLISIPCSDCEGLQRNVFLHLKWYFGAKTTRDVRLCWWQRTGWFENAVHQNAGSAVQSSALLSRCPRARRRTPKWPALPCKCSSGVWMGDWKATLWIALGTVSADRSPSYRERNQTMLRKHAIWFQGCLLLSRFSKHRNIV